MISYKPFWETLKKSSETTYTLIHKYNISSATIDRLRRDKPLSTITIDDLCRILHCGIEGIATYVPRKRMPVRLNDKKQTGLSPATVLYLHTAPNVFGRATNKRRPSLCQKSEEMIPAGAAAVKNTKTVIFHWKKSWRSTAETA